MKKKLTIISALLLVLTLLTACGTSTETVFDVAERGIQFEISEEYLDKGVTVQNYNENEKGYKNVTIYYYSPEGTELIKKVVYATSEEHDNGAVDDYMQKISGMIRCLMEVTLVENDEYEKAMAAGGKAEDFTDFAPAEYYGTNEGYTYLVSIPDLDDGSLTAESAKEYHACKEYMETVKKNIKLIPLTQEKKLDNAMPAFKTTDIMGNEVTNEVFGQADFTVVNIWGTFCGPCIDEMPELAQMSEKYAGKVQFLGLVGDLNELDDTEHLELAKKITEKAGVKYTNLVANDDFNDLISNIVGFPTTLFVDSSGNIIGDSIVGAGPYEIEKRIESLIAANN